MATVLRFRPATDRARPSSRAAHPLLDTVAALLRGWRLEAELRALSPRMLRDIGLEPAVAADPLRRPGL
jgi:uncharacterized protein YjiS (DUF1127 family)